MAASPWLPPYDWKALARACLTGVGGDFLLWASDYVDICSNTADLNAQAGNGVTYEQLTGEGAYRDLQQQMNLPQAAFAQIHSAAQCAWKKLPSDKRFSEDLTKVRQGPDEPYQEFVARLLEAVAKTGADEGTVTLIAKHLAFENANSACQAAIRPYRKRGNLTNFMRMCSDIGPAYTQAAYMAAMMQGKPVQEVVAQQRQGRGRGRRRVSVGGPCFACGKMEHRAAQCPGKGAPPTSSSPKAAGLCPRCRRGYHWARDCRSKVDAAGKPFAPLQGNWVRGPLQAPRQCYGAFPENNEIPQARGSNPFLTSLEQPQAAQDWTSVPPPTQY